MTFPRWVSIHTGALHYLDHLAPLCHYLDIPLLLTDRTSYKAAEKFYPFSLNQFIELNTLSLNYLSQNFDVIFESGHRWAVELLPILDFLFHKKLRLVYCPHGNSDKGFSQSTVLRKDISLIYGNYMQNHLKKTGELDQLSAHIIIGNYRLAYYKLYQNFYDDVFKQCIVGQLRSDLKTIIYAPTWSDGENISTFETYVYSIIDQIQGSYNLIIKWHPFLEESHPWLIEKCIEKFTKKGVIFLPEFPCIYSILNHCDAYIGDFSSIGYDFLSFNRPLYFLDKHHGAIYKCGKLLSSKTNFLEQIDLEKDQTIFNEARLSLYQDTFAPFVSSSELIESLKKALFKERPSWAAS